MSRYPANINIGPRYLAEVDMDYLYLDQDNIVAIQKLKEDILGGTYLNSATAEMVLFDLSGTTVSGASFPITLTYQTGSAGYYEGHLPASSLTLTEGTEYDLEVTVDSGGAQVAEWIKRLVAVKRRP